MKGESIPEDPWKILVQLSGIFWKWKISDV